LICSFCCGRKEKSTGQKRPDQNPQSVIRFAGFCVWGQMKVMMMQQHKDRPIRWQHRPMMTGGWKRVLRPCPNPPQGHPKVKTGEVRLVGKATGKIVIGSGWAAPGSIWQAVADDES
jgi:hypothetical protein